MRTESSSHTYAKLPALLMLPTAPGEPDSDTTMPFPVATSKLYLPSFSITRSSLRMGTCSLLSSKRACPCSDSYWGAAKTPTTTRESTTWNEKLGDVSVVGSSRMNHYDIMKRNGYWRLKCFTVFLFSRHDHPADQAICIIFHFFICVWVLSRDHFFLTISGITYELHLATFQGELVRVSRDPSALYSVRWPRLPAASQQVNISLLLSIFMPQGSASLPVLACSFPPSFPF